MAKVLRFTGSVYLLLLALAIGCASSARLLDELEQPIGPNPLLPSGQIPAVVEDVATSAPADPLPVPPVEVPGPASPAPLPVPPVEVPGPLPVPASSASGGGGGGAATSASGGGGSGVATSASGSGGGGGAGASGGASAGGASLSFFMHDIVGGSGPTSRMVTGLVASAVSNVAFTKPNNNLFPVSGGVPLTSANVNGFLNSNRNNLPLLAGLNGQQPTGFSNAQTSTVIQNAGNNNIVSGGTSLPFVAGGQLPAGAATLQKLMFGSVTVIDDQLSEAHELGSPVLGRAQGFYLASSLDGNSHTMVITLILHGAPGEHHVDDTISIFGVHRTATLVSHVAVIGGTGKFENAQGYATVESLPQVDQHTTDGVDTIMHVNVYLSD